jgi:hypothetical protein
MTDFALPARVQPQLWVNDNAMNSGPSIKFDASRQMLKLNALQFRSIAEEILIDNGHDYEDLALNAGIADIDEWLAKNAEGTILVTIEDYDFTDWLKRLGVTEQKGFSMTEELLETIRGRVREEEPEAADGDDADAVAAPSGGM